MGAFSELIERNNDALHTIAEKASQTPIDAKLAPETRKVGDYYASGMNEKAVEAAGPSRWKRNSSKSTQSKTVQDVLKEIAHLHNIGISAFFEFWLRPGREGQHDGHRPGVQGGLGMPDRDYYTRRTTI